MYKMYGHIIPLLLGLILASARITGAASEYGDIFLLTVELDEQGNYVYGKSYVVLDKYMSAEREYFLGFSSDILIYYRGYWFSGVDVQRLNMVWYEAPRYMDDRVGRVYIYSLDDEGYEVTELSNVLAAINRDTLYSVSPDGRYYFFYRTAETDVTLFEHYELKPQINKGVYQRPYIAYIYRYDTDSGKWERLCFNYENRRPLVSSDGRFLIYYRELADYRLTPTEIIPESIICRADGWFKAEFTRPLTLEPSGYEIGKEPRDWRIVPAFDRIKNDDEESLVYYYTTPYLRESTSSEEVRYEGVEWLIIRFRVPPEIVNFDISTFELAPLSVMEYEIKAEVIDLGIPFNEFDYVRDVRFRSDGRYVSLVGVKDEVRKLYIYDIEEKELHEVEGSEGALTTRWLEIIE
jgi:hypothetical protein